MIRLISRGLWILVFATLIVLVSTFNTINPAEYKASFERLVSDRLGRDIAVERAGLEWALPPRIVLHNVRIADRGVARNGRREVMQAKRVVAELDMIPLTYGRVVAPRVRLENVELALQTGGRAGTGGAGSGGSAGGLAPVPPFGSMLSTLGPALGVGGLLISGLTVVMRDGGSTSSSTVVNLGDTVVQGASRGDSGWFFGAAGDSEKREKDDQQGRNAGGGNKPGC